MDGRPSHKRRENSLPGKPLPSTLSSLACVPVKLAVTEIQAKDEEVEESCLPSLPLICFKNAQKLYILVYTILDFKMFLTPLVPVLVAYQHR